MRVGAAAAIAALLLVCALLACVVAVAMASAGASPATPAVLRGGLKRVNVDELFVPTLDLTPGVRCQRGGKDQNACVFGLCRLAGRAPGGDVTVTLSSHLGGAVYKLTYGGVEFVDPVPIVGASMQTALVFDGKGEYNPTEGGNGELDSFTGKSSTQILEAWAGDRAVSTSARLAYFLRPGTGSARHTGIVSDVVLSKRVEFVDVGVLDYTVSLAFPGDKHYFSLVEVLATWVPVDACRQMVVHSGGGWRSFVLDELYWAEGTRQGPASSGLVLGVADGSVAMGVALLEWPRGGQWESPRFSMPDTDPRWRKWSIVQRIGLPSKPSFRIPAQTATWKIRMYFGSVEQVKRAVAR